MLEAHSKLIVKWIGGFCATLLIFTMVSNMNSRDFKRISFKILSCVPRLIWALSLDLSITPPVMVTQQAPRADRILIRLAKNDIHCFCCFSARIFLVLGGGIITGKGKKLYEDHDHFLHFVLKYTIKKHTEGLQSLWEAS